MNDLGTADLLRAVILAEKAHRGQKRDAGEPYIIHPLDVGLRLLEAGAPVYVAIGGILHDVKEDSKKYAPRIWMDFGPVVDGLVTEVSNVYVPGEYKGWTPEQCKDAEATRLRNISDDGKAIKFADIGSNASTVDGMRRERRDSKLKEYRFLLERMKEGGWALNPTLDYLYKKAWKTVNLAMLKPA